MESRKGNISSLSPELLCHIFKFLPLRDVLLLGILNKKLSSAVSMHFLLCKEIDFCDRGILNYMPSSITDEHILSLLKKCPRLEIVYGLHPRWLQRRRLRKRSALSIPGIIEALCLCLNLKKIEISNLKLLEAISHHLPLVEIIGHFRNRDGCFPPNPSQELKLPFCPRISSLHLIGVEVPEIPVMNELKHLHLHWVRFTRVHPFKSFSAIKLETFVLRHCIGPSVPMRYLPLFVALSFAPNLSRLELVRVPLPEGLIQRAVEDTWKSNGFRQLRKIVIGECKGILESDVGLLMIVSSQSLESVTLQSSLTKDSLFVSLHFARCDFSHMKYMHLGYDDPFPPKDETFKEYFQSLGLPEPLDAPSSLTDSGIKIVCQLFPNVRNLTIANCPHLSDASLWFVEDCPIWQNLIYLTMERCHCLRLRPFSKFIAQLKRIETLILMHMFREPPKGCSHVGLSAGTGLGLSSAVVSTEDEHIDVIDMDDEPQLDDIPPPQGNNEEDFDDADNEGQALLSLDDQMHDEENYHSADDTPKAFKRSENGQEHEDDFDDEVQQGKSSFSRRFHSVQSSSNVIGIKKSKRDKNPGSKAIPVDEAYSSVSDSGTSESKVKICEIHKNNSACNCNTDADFSRPSTSKDSRTSYKSVRERQNDSDYRGPLTRHRKQMLSPSKPSSSQRFGSHSARKTSNSTSHSNKHTGSKKIKSNHHKANKERLTSNPYADDDPIQTLHIKSPTLASFTLISCGISEIVLHHCSTLMHLEAQDCRIFKKLKFVTCYPPTKINIIQCPKLDLEEFLYELLIMDSDKAVLIYIEPCMNKKYKVAQTEHTVLFHSPRNSSVAVLHEYGSNSTDRGLYRDFSLTMMKLVQQLFDVLQQMLLSGMKKDEFSSESTDVYPWGHKVSRVYSGSSSTNYEILTNNSVLSTVWKEIEASPQEFLTLDPLKLLQFDIADLIESGRAYTRQFIGVYVCIPDSNYVE